MLPDREWNLKYTPEDGDLVTLFYVPALEDAERYDRLTGYFNAGALALAARGVEGLVRDGGRMRLVVGCTLGPPEIEAIYSRDAKHAKTQLVYAVLSAPGGCPVAVQAYPGNTADPNTVPDQVTKLQERFGLERVVLVGDRGVLTQVQTESKCSQCREPPDSENPNTYQ